MCISYGFQDNFCNQAPFSRVLQKRHVVFVRIYKPVEEWKRRKNKEVLASSLTVYKYSPAGETKGCSKGLTKYLQTWKEPWLQIVCITLPGTHISRIYLPSYGSRSFKVSKLKTIWFDNR